MGIRAAVAAQRYKYGTKPPIGQGGADDEEHSGHLNIGEG